MNCFYHPTETSVAVCQDCQKGLCPGCAIRYSIPICVECNKARLSFEKKEILKELAITFGLGMILTYFYFTSVGHKAHVDLSFLDKTFTYIIMFYLFSSIVSGWKTLNAITPNVFLFLPILGWLFYFIVKFVISMFIGPFMLPIRLFRKLIRWRELNEIEQIA